ncbi:MAG: efflux RND transporter periplasmic adaptor subunit [Proteobacteria bacterium]|nr:efflux RND transporter periplasmic adaptor subunit [Pseudomonadota bacterium]
MNVTTKRTIIVVGVVAVVGGLLFGFQIFKGIMIAKFMNPGSLPPQTVSTITAKMQPWQPTISAVGSLRAERGADLSVEVPGIVDAIHFESGDEVKAGTILVELRIEDEQARLAALQTSADLARTQFERNQRQFEAKAISKAALDVDAANLKNAEAAVTQQRATLNKKVVRAPFAGRLGVRRVDQGQYINPGEAVVTLQSLESIFADFYLPAEDAARVAVNQKVRLTTDATGEETFDGTIAAIDPKVDLKSRNVLVRARFANKNHHLLPGASANLTIEAGKPQQYLTLPQTAITFNPYGSTVYVAMEDGKDDKGQPKLTARQTFVTTGATRGDQIAVTSGIKEGDVVVTAGQMKLLPGSPLVINNTLQPSMNPAPKPVMQ